jgi:hypothetical protein
MGKTMIYIFFSSGAFGSTIEYSIRRFAKEFKTVDAAVLADGSMHSFSKECHPVNLDQLTDIDPDVNIVTPIYPNWNLLSVKDTIDEFKKIVTSDDKVIFITQDNITSAARHELFVYHKLGIIEKRFKLSNIQQWNKNYNSFDDMQSWEKREYLSLIYNELIVELLNAKNYSDYNWYTITTNNILFDFEKTIKNIINYLELTFIDDGIDEFYNTWKEKQKYILDDYQLVEKIVNTVITDQELSWGKLNLVTESLIQYKLKLAGFELQCFNLNSFPSNSTQLKQLLARTA